MRRSGRASRRPVSALVAVLLLVGLEVALAPPADAASSVRYNGSRARPYIALTIDDGYNPSNCRVIADILRARGVPATFFPYGNAVSSSTWTWRHIAAEGFAIGNHTVTHRYMTRLPWGTQRWEIIRDHQIVESATGRQMSRYFRPPYGAYNSTTLNIAGAYGFPYTVLWDTSFADTASGTDYQHYRSATRGTNGSIILAHCGPAVTVRIMASVVAYYKSRGFQFVTLDKLFGLSPMPTPTARSSVTLTPSPTVTPTPTPSLTPSPVPSAMLGPAASSPVAPDWPSSG